MMKFWSGVTAITLNDDDDPDKITVIPETPPEPESDNDSDATENDSTSPEHKVTFKCIGCTKKQPHQRVAQL